MSWSKIDICIWQWKKLVLRFLRTKFIPWIGTPIRYLTRCGIHWWNLPVRSSEVVHCWIDPSFQEMRFSKNSRLLDAFVLNHQWNFFLEYNSEFLELLCPLLFVVNDCQVGLHWIKRYEVFLFDCKILAAFITPFCSSLSWKLDPDNNTRLSYVCD